MSLETQLEDLCSAIRTLTTVVEGLAPAARTAPTPAVAVVAAPPPLAPAPVAAVPVMPPPPFMSPAPTPVVTQAAPFTDGKGLIDYVMGAYKAMGPQKGAQIQGVMGSMGYQNINDVKPEHYGALFAGVEALKVS